MFRRSTPSNDRRARRASRRFAKFCERARPKLETRYGKDFSDAVLASAHEHYLRILPTIPDIGGFRNVFSPVMTLNGWGVALHAALKERGKTAVDTVAICSEIADDFFRSAPPFLLAVSGRYAFNPLARRFFEKQAERSRARAYAEDFVYEIEEGADGEFSLVFSECAVNKFYDKNGLEDLKPYCNFFDVTYSRLMNMGCDAQETIGLGCEKCALRFKHGRATAVPDALKGVLPRT